jgi:hypothetical protein
MSKLQQATTTIFSVSLAAKNLAAAASNLVKDNHVQPSYFYLIIIILQLRTYLKKYSKSNEWGSTNHPNKNFIQIA